jgi:hypothetical protein
MLTCLDILKIKDYCDPTETGPFVSDFVDVNNILFAHLADPDEQTGKAYALELLESAKAEIEADLLLSASDGYSVKNVVYHYANTCRFSDSYVATWGVSITNFYRSPNSVLNIPTINFKPEFTGSFNLVIDDGKTKTIIPATATEKIENTIAVDYKTTEKTVRIYAEDPTLKFALQSCTTGGCGSCASKRGIFVSATGWNGSAVTSQPSGFIPTAFISCNLDAVICNVIKNYKPLIAKALAYKVGIDVYNRLLISPRMNDSTLNIDGDAARSYLNTLVAKYRELMFGSAQAYGNAATTGIISVIRQSFKTMNDPCVECRASMSTITATL